jgi:hypothetical protein
MCFYGKMHFPSRYVPKTLSKKDRKTQISTLMKSRRLYSRHKYFPHEKLASFRSKESAHVTRAKRLYQVDSVAPSLQLARKTGCTVSALKKIVNKGEGAYYSSGSRPNQTASSWGLARLASAITGGNAAKVDFNILENGCDPKKKAFQLAKRFDRR